jgi:hypothetical protein
MLQQEATEVSLLYTGKDVKPKSLLTKADMNKRAAIVLK